MSALFQRHPLLVALAVLAALLAGAIGIEIALGTSSARMTAAGPAPASADTKILPPLAPAVPEQAYPEMTARPLFLATRRPAPEAPVQQGSMVKGQFILQGVTISGDTRIALLREKTSGRTLRVERGKEVNGVTLASVDPDRVVLALGGDREELVLTVQKGPAPPPQPMPGPGPVAPMPMPVAPVAPPFAPPVGQPVTGAGPFLPPGFNPTPPAAAPAKSAPQAAQAPATPLTPEEILARRRARRTPDAPQ
jgi:hypothetical protein